MGILKAAGKRVGAAMFWKLLIGTVLMLLFCYLGEVEALPKFVGFPLGMSGWFFILFEIFPGEAGGTAGDCSEAVASAFSTMRLIVSIGWSIYPIGFVLGWSMGRRASSTSTSLTTSPTWSTKLRSSLHVGRAPNRTAQRNTPCCRDANRPILALVL